MKILILGVGSAQADAIEYLKKKGHEVHGISYRNEGPGIALSDKFEEIDIADVSRVEDFALKNGIDLVYSVGSDLALGTIAVVSEKLGLPSFFTNSQVNIARDKYKMREFLRNLGLCDIEFLKASSPEELKQWNRFPAVMKPVDSQGQRGVVKVDTCQEILSHFNDSKGFSGSEQVLIEEYVEGIELSVNSFRYNGKTIFNCITRRESAGSPYFGIVKSHTIPAGIDKDTEEKVLGLVEQLSSGYGIQNGPLYFQMIINNSNVNIVEFSPRLDGCHLWKLIKYSSGIDLLDLTFSLLLNGKFDHEIKISETIPHKLEFILAKPGEKFRLPDYDIDEKAVNTKYYYESREIVRPVNGKLEKAGYRIVTL